MAAQQGTAAAVKALGPAPGSFLSTSRGRTHYALQGPVDSPLLVLQHGISSNLTTWDRIAGALVQDGYRVLRFDFYDRGWSETSPERYPVLTVGVHPVDFTIDLYVEQFVDVLDQLQLADTPFVFAGSSTGGALAIAYAARRPGHARGLLLLSPVCLPANTTLAAKLADMPCIGPLIVQHLGARRFLAVNRTMRHEPTQPWHEQGLRELERLLESNARFLAAMRSTLSHCRGFNHGDLLPEYEAACRSGVPIQLIWGTADSSTPFEHAGRLLEVGQRLQADVRLTPLEGVPHMLYTQEAGEGVCLELFRAMMREVLGDPVPAAPTGQGPVVAVCGL